MRHIPVETTRHTSADGHSFRLTQPTDDTLLIVVGKDGIGAKAHEVALSGSFAQTLRTALHLAFPTWEDADVQRVLDSGQEIQDINDDSMAINVRLS